MDPLSLEKEMARELTDDEADTVMANIHPWNRRWCVASCGPRPGDDVELLKGYACACMGCIQGQLSWEDFAAWEERERSREPTPYIDSSNAPEPRKLTLAERLEAYKRSKRSPEH